MNEGTKYVKIIEWSEEDQCFIGSCPELFYGGCHGDNEYEVFNELCKIIEETIKINHFSACLLSGRPVCRQAGMADSHR